MLRRTRTIVYERTNIKSGFFATSIGDCMFSFVIVLGVTESLNLKIFRLYNDQKTIPPNDMAEEIYMSLIKPPNKNKPNIIHAGEINKAKPQIKIKRSGSLPCLIIFSYPFV